jgi:opacity protein-like surface antigen
MDSMFGTAKVRPYVGATLGYIRYDEDVIVDYNDNRILDDEANDRNTTISNKDGYYGLDFGMLFYVTDNIDMDVSYHYYFMDRLEPLDTMRGATFALHYFY